MERITSVKVTSRRSSKIGDEFFTFEMTTEANTENMTDEEKKEYVKKLWDYASSEVDNQIVETAKAIQ